MRDRRGVAAPQLDRLGVHALREKALSSGPDNQIVRRDLEPRTELFPGWRSLERFAKGGHRRRTLSRGQHRRALRVDVLHEDRSEVLPVKVDQGVWVVGVERAVRSKELAEGGRPILLAELGGQAE